MNPRYQELVSDTESIFDKWTERLENFVNVAIASKYDLVLNRSRHAIERGEERNITTFQMKHVIKNFIAITGIQKTTQEGIYKLRVEGNDFDDNLIELIIILSENLGSGIKVITGFTKGEK